MRLKIFHYQRRRDAVGTLNLPLVAGHSIFFFFYFMVEMEIAATGLAVSLLRVVLAEPLPGAAAATTTDRLHPSAARGGYVSLSVSDRDAPVST